MPVGLCSMPTQRIEFPVPSLGFAVPAGTVNPSSARPGCRTCSVVVTATDGSGFSGSATFRWDIAGPAGANTVTVANPGAQSSPAGTAVTAVDNSATDSSPTATIASWSATGLPAGLSLAPTTGAISGTRPRPARTR